MRHRQEASSAGTRAFITLGLTLGLLVPFGAAPASAATTEGRITFDNGGPTRPWVVDADGVDRREIASSGGANLGYPRLSPDGRTVSYLTITECTGCFEIWRADVASGDIKKIVAVNKYMVYWGAPWSPDGKRIAYTAYNDTGVYLDVAKRKNDVHIVTRTGGKVRKIDACAGMSLPEVHWLDWSGNGKLWAACEPNSANPAATAAFDSRWRVYRMNADGSGQTVIHILPQRHQVRGLAVSRDGKKVLVSSEHRDTDARRAVIIRSSGVTRIDALYEVTSWSPDGKHLVGWTSGAGLWRIKANGTGKQAIPGTQAQDLNPHWSKVEPCAGGAQPSNGGVLLIGDAGNNLLEGTDGNDVICGGGGNDILIGNGGNDVIYGDAGDDQLVGGAGNDRLEGGSGADLLKGGPGDDRLVGGPGTDRLEGEDGDDTIIARDGVRDQVRGGGGRDKARIDPGLDLVVSVETLLP
jgi:hypothetical protein